MNVIHHQRWHSFLAFQPVCNILIISWSSFHKVFAILTLFYLLFSNFKTSHSTKYREKLSIMINLCSALQSKLGIVCVVQMTPMMSKVERDEGVLKIGICFVLPAFTLWCAVYIYKMTHLAGIGRKTLHVQFKGISTNFHIISIHSNEFSSYVFLQSLPIYSISWTYEHKVGWICHSLAHIHKYETALSSIAW